MHKRWAALWILMPGLVVGLALAKFAGGQFGRETAPGEDGLQPPAMIVPPGRETVQALQHARDALQQGRTGDGIQLLQRLIELPEDYFTDSSMKHTLKSETLQILAGLNEEQRKAYDLLRGKAAAALLEDAKTASDPDRLGDVVRRFPMTAASIEAGEMLALTALDQGRPWHAAVLLSQLGHAPILSQNERRQLAIREAFAWQAAGQTDRAAELLVEFTSQAGDSAVQIGDRALPKFDDAEAAARWLAQVSPLLRTAVQEASHWLSPRGNSAGAIRVKTSGPVGGPLWHVDALALSAADLAPRDDVDAPARLLQELARAEAPLRDAEHLLWTTTVPLVVVDDLIVFRSARDVVALDRLTGDVRWRSVLSDPDFETLWNGELSRPERINLPATSPVAEYLSERYYEDRTFGALSSDGRFVFAIEGLGYVSSAAALNEVRAAMQAGGDPWGAANRLTAYELEGGRLAWEIGGDRAETAGDFAGHFFLGPPISVAGQLLILAEVQGEVRLIVLEAEDRGGKKIWSQPLAAPSYKITEQDERRRLGLMSAYADGIVICPTDAGVTIAVDLLQRRLMWAYSYPSTSATAGNQPGFGPMIVRPNMAMPPATDDPGWQDSTPVIAGGRVYLTPSDSDELHCVQLTDGKLLWKIPRGAAAYLAGADAERAVVIGPGRIEAVQAANNGIPAWKEPLQVPAVTGRGVWLADRYLVPLSNGEIASIDLASGRILARSKLPAGQLPGHLATGSGALVSLSARDVLSFRSQSDIEKVLTERLAANADDPAALALRGEERLHRGEREAGLADLRAAVSRQPDRYTKSVLAAALLEGLRNDFTAHRAAIAELDSLTDDPDQRTEFLWLVARGLRNTADRRAAFDRMLPLLDHSLDEITPDGVGSPWSARTDRRLAGHFATLYRDATPDERAAFDTSIANLLPAESAEVGDLIQSYRRFLRTFDFHPAATVARQKLIDLLGPAVGPGTPGLEYVWQLAMLADNSDAAIAAQATGKLARWHLAQRRYADVTPLLALLEGRFADSHCEPDITGWQLAAQLREDAGYIAFGKDVLPWPNGKVEVERINPTNPARLVRATIVGHVPSHYQGWTFETDPQGTMLFAKDHLFRQRWRLTRAAASPQQVFGEVPVGLHRIHLYDHLVGWSTGSDFLIAADLEPEPAAPKILWHDSLLPPGSDPAEFASRVIRLQRGAFARRRAFVNPMPQRGGELVAITRSAVVYHNGRKLIAAEPLTGKLLWSRGDLPAGNLALAAADDQAIALLEAARPGDAAAQTVHRLRAIDGEALPAVPSPQGLVEWIGGSRVLRLVPEDAGKSLELFDLDRGESVWQADHAAKTVVRGWNQSEVYVLEENRRLSLRDLADGTIRWTQEFDFKVPIDTFFVQRWKDRLLLVFCSTTPGPVVPGSAQAVGFNQFDGPMTGGYVVAVKHDTGEIAWERPVNDLPTEPAVYDTTQPTGWPMLVFAGRLMITPQAGAPQIPRLTATFIDKETGQVKYSVEEPSNIGMYFIEADPDRNRLTANFATFALELHYTGN